MFYYLLLTITVLHSLGGTFDVPSSTTEAPIPGIRLEPIITEIDCNCSPEVAMLQLFQSEVQKMKSLLNELTAKEVSNLVYFQRVLNELTAAVDQIEKSTKVQLKKEMEPFQAAIKDLFKKQDELKDHLQIKIEVTEHDKRDIAIKADKIHILNLHNSSSSEYPTSCAHSNGVYSVDVPTYDLPFAVACDYDIQAGGWLVIQRRMNGRIDFHRNWTEYQQGFGDLNGEFWLGLDKLHALTTSEPQDLLIVIENFNRTRHYAWYDAFEIGNENEGYYLKTLGKYSGDAGDSLNDHRNMKFSTKDVDNDLVEDLSCANYYTGGWWYSKCLRSNLNGRYLRGKISQYQRGEGVTWGTYNSYYSLKFTQMMIRPKSESYY